MNFIEWNNVVACHLFKVTRKDQEVFLCLSEDDLIKAVTTAANKPNASSAVRQVGGLSKSEVVADFWRALKRGPVFWGKSTQNGQQEDPITGKTRLAPRNPAEYAKYSWDDWNRCQRSVRSPGVRIINYYDKDAKISIKISIEAPLHLLYLLSFTLPLGAVNTEDSNKYYDAWNSFFQAPGRSLLSKDAKLSSNAIRCLGESVWADMWREIARWSSVDLAGERGVSVIRLFTNQNWKYVGIPLSQCLLPPVCLRRLDRQFYKHGFTAQAATRLSADALKACLLDVGNVLPSRTKDVLNSATYPEVREAVVEQVRGRLKLYNGLVPAERQEESNGKNRIYTGQVLAAAIGELVLFTKLGFGTPTFYHRLHPRAEAEAELNLNHEGVHYPCKVGAAWSERIDNVPLRVGALVLEDRARHWKAVANFEAIQFFAIASDIVGLPDYVAVDEPQLGELLVICQPAHADVLRTWLMQCGKIVQERFLTVGSVTGCLCAKVLVERLCAVPHNLPVCIKAEKSIEQIGGLRIERGDYLADAMPLFRVSSSLSLAKLHVVYPSDSTKQPLLPVSEKPNLWELPPTLRADEPFYVETDDSLVASRPLRAVRALLPASVKRPDIYRGVLLEQCAKPDKSACFVNGLSIEAPEERRQEVLRRYKVLYNHYFTGTSTRDYTLPTAKLAPTAFAEADRILYLLSARGKLERESFREVFGSLHPEAGDEWRYAMRWYGQLGHAAYQYERGRDVLTVLPPTLSLLPGAGSNGSRFLLTGTRLPGMLVELAQWKPGAIKVYTMRQHASNQNLLLPDAAIVECNPAEIQKIVEAFGLRFQTWMPTTAQWMLLGGTLSQYQASMTAVDIGTLPPPDAMHRYFDPESLTMKGVQLAPDGTLPYCKQKGALVEYEMRRGQERFRLWLDGIAYMVEPAWGRYIVLQKYRKNALEVRGDKLLVPATAPLPGGTGLAASLLDGLVPDIQRINGRRYYEYPATAYVLLKNELRALLEQELVV